MDCRKIRTAGVFFIQSRFFVILLSWEKTKVDRAQVHLRYTYVYLKRWLNSIGQDIASSFKLFEIHIIAS
jgi:hypothetical protein